MKGAYVESVEEPEEINLIFELVGRFRSNSLINGAVRALSSVCGLEKGCKLQVMCKVLVSCPSEILQ